MKKMTINDKVSWVLFLLYTITFGVNYVTIRNIALVPFIMCMIALVFCMVFLRKLNSIYYIGIVAFSGFALFFGTMLNLYDIIPIYDILLHFASGILLVFLGHFVYEWFVRNEDKIPLKVTILVCILLSISGAAFWEIWEFTGDSLLGLDSQGAAISDTMSDIIAGTIGAFIGGYILWMVLKKRERKALK